MWIRGGDIFPTFVDVLFPGEGGTRSQEGKAAALDALSKPNRPYFYSVWTFTSASKLPSNYHC